MIAQMSVTQLIDGIRAGKSYRIDLHGVQLLAHSWEGDDDTETIEFQLPDLESRGIAAWGYVDVSTLPALLLCEEVR